ncbi:MAG: TonB-dependent receptor, partial [bacterium]
VISEKDLKRYGGINMYDSLRQVSGLHIMAGTVSQPDISIRGMNELNSNSTLLLIDGRNIYLPIQGVFLWETIPIQMNEIKQIEVVKGPVASLYGANAFSGMINVISKSPDEINGTIVSCKAGSDNTYIGSLVHGNKLDILGYKVSLGWKRFDMFEHDDYETDLNKFNTELVFDLNNVSKLSLSGGAVFGEFPLNVGTLGEYNNESSYAKIEYVYDDLECKLFWNYGNVDYITAKFGTIDALMHDYEVEIKYNFDVLDKHTVTFGGGGRYDYAKSNILATEDNEKDQTLWNVYIQDDFELTDKFRLVSSGKLDHHSIAGYNPTGRVAGIYWFTEHHLLRTSAGNSFRTPTLNEYYERLSYAGQYTVNVNGNKDLTAEKIITGEIGYDGSFYDKKIKSKLDVFCSRIRNSIDTANAGMSSLAPPVIEQKIMNAGKIYTWGIEPEIKYKITDWLTCTANYSYQDIDFNDGVVVKYTPKHKVNMSTILTIMKNITASVYGHYVGEAEVSDALSVKNNIDEYFLLNARMAYEFFDDAEIGVSGSNLNNDKHREMIDGEEIGMRIIGDVTVKF